MEWNTIWKKRIFPHFCDSCNSREGTNHHWIRPLHWPLSLTNHVALTIVYTCPDSVSSEQQLATYSPPYSIKKNFLNKEGKQYLFVDYWNFEDLHTMWQLSDPDLPMKPRLSFETEKNLKESALAVLHNKNHTSKMESAAIFKSFKHHILEMNILNFIIDPIKDRGCSIIFFASKEKRDKVRKSPSFNDDEGAYSFVDKIERKSNQTTTNQLLVPNIQDQTTFPSLSSNTNQQSTHQANLQHTSFVSRFLNQSQTPISNSSLNDVNANLTKIASQLIEANNTLSKLSSNTQTQHESLNISISKVTHTFNDVMGLVVNNIADLSKVISVLADYIKQTQTKTNYIKSQTISISSKLDEMSANISRATTDHDLKQADIRDDINELHNAINSVEKRIDETNWSNTPTTSTLQTFFQTTQKKILTHIDSLFIKSINQWIHKNTSPNTTEFIPDSQSSDNYQNSDEEENNNQFDNELLTRNQTPPPKQSTNNKSKKTLPPLLINNLSEPDTPILHN